MKFINVKPNSYTPHRSRRNALKLTIGAAVLSAYTVWVAQIHADYRKVNQESLRATAVSEIKHMRCLEREVAGTLAAMGLPYNPEYQAPERKPEL